MKFLGLNISLDRAVGDRVTVSSVKPESGTIPVSQIPSVRPRVLKYGQSYSSGRGSFSAGEYDLAEIGKIEDTDGYVRQAFKKKVGLMFKEGVGYSGPDKRTARYVKTRFAQISRATGIPHVQLLKRVAQSLIRVSNAFIIKVRDEKASGGRKRVTADGKELKPIAGLFPAAPETMRFEMNENTGKILRWKQMLPDGKFRFFSVDDVVHFCIDRREGFIFGVPTLIPVIDDIRALRQIEENVELLLYQYLFPLFHYKVGTETAPAGFTEDGLREIEVVEEQIQYMPAEGAIVTPERHEITAIGAEGRALRAEGYLEHFKKRIFAGLGVSQVDMGDGDTTNRATAQTMSRALIDTVKDVQDELEAQWDHEVISELLLESTFGDRVLDEEFMVHLQFKEIDLQNKMESEKHSVELFEGNAITWDELRAEMGREPIEVPEDPEDQDPSKYPDWFNTHWKLFKEPETIIKAVDEPYSVAAKMAAEARTLGVVTGQIVKSKEETEASQRAQAEADRQTKMAVAQSRPRTRQDNFVAASFKQLEEDTVRRVRANLITRGHMGPEHILSMARIWAADTTERLYSVAVTELIRGFNLQTGNRSSESPNLISQGRYELRERIEFFVNKLIHNMVALAERRIDAINGNVKLPEVQKKAMEEVHLAFDSVRWRTKLIWDIELRKAYNYGRVLGMRFLGLDYLRLDAANGACEQCQAVNGRLIEVAAANINDVPPLHPHSRMSMTALVAEDGSKFVPPRNKGKPAVEQNDPSLSKKTGVCPQCGNTVTLQPRSGAYYCMKCVKAFPPEDVEGDVDDATKLERCVLSVKAQLRKKNPGMSEKEIKTRAFKICNAQLKG